jgi:DNA-binding CsgD family transcriptional regulator
VIRFLGDQPWAAMNNAASMVADVGTIGMVHMTTITEDEVRAIFARSIASGGKLIVSKSLRPPLPTQEELRERYKFTPRESAIAKHIAGGGSTRSAAESLGIHYEAVRSHLKHIFSKTYTHTQNELGALLRSL